MTQPTTLFTHELLDSGAPSGIHFGTDDFDTVKKSHVDGETSVEISVWYSENEVQQLHQEIQELKQAKEELLDALFDALSLLRDDYPRTVEHMLELYTKHLNSYKD